VLAVGDVALRRRPIGLLDERRHHPGVGGVGDLDRITVMDVAEPHRRLGRLDADRDDVSLVGRRYGLAHRVLESGAVHDHVIGRE
jgi:hypothetical protein